MSKDMFNNDLRVTDSFGTKVNAANTPLPDRASPSDSANLTVPQQQTEATARLRILDANDGLYISKDNEDATTIAMMICRGDCNAEEALARRMVNAFNRDAAFDALVDVLQKTRKEIDFLKTGPKGRALLLEIDAALRLATDEQ